MMFRKTWRVYQSRLLDHLDGYLQSNRLHLVAAPGSGKTVLGLEVIKRVNRPTLVLAPTITIRDQWVDRLVDLFLPPGSGKPGWVSTELRNPAFLTIATYQALHAVCSDEPEEPKQPSESEENSDSGNHALEQLGNCADASHGAQRQVLLPESFVQAKFRALVLDEAHHLRAEWWKTLTSVAEQLEKPTIVALTATPPYDVSPFEWQRYEELCGPVDAEVSVPELVLQGDLCPHQDYVYFSAPTEKEQKVISEFRAAVDLFVGRLRSNESFKDAILAHRWISTPDEYSEEILDDPEYLSSIVVFLHATGREVPRAVLRTLGLSHKQIPTLELEWLEVLLSRFLYSDIEKSRHGEQILKSIRRELQEIGAIERRRVKLRDPSDHLKLLTTSITKLKSMEEIVRLEAGAQGDELRCVILTDFIRRAEMPTSAGELAVCEDIGIVPIFEYLRHAALSDIRLGVLSGSLVIIPNSAEPLLKQAAAALGIHPRDLLISPLTHDPTFSSVEIRGEHYRGSVRLITSVFQQGE
jgi:hypothetical protein